MAARFTIVGIGEALFDLLPAGRALGGAPLNLALHADQLSKPLGGRGVPVSRVGQDELGRELEAQLKARSIDTTYLQTDPDYPTGVVHVDLDEAGQPRYDIAENVAWDWLQFDPDADSLASRCQAVCFGTLGQRNPQARSAINRFLTAARGAIRLFDVNLRTATPDLIMLRRSLEFATALKLNEQELGVLSRMFGFTGETADARIASLFRQQPQIKLAALTRGSQGAVLYPAGGSKVEAAPVLYPPAADADAVGAGDAFSAGLLVGLIQRWQPARILELASHCGGFVASQPGATPAFPESLLKLVSK